jgi:hypothetical protein
LSATLVAVVPGVELWSVERAIYNTINNHRCIAEQNNHVEVPDYWRC